VHGVRRVAPSVPAARERIRHDHDPATFTSRDAVRRTVPSYDDPYTAAAFITIEGGRPSYHVCEEQARRELAPRASDGTFRLDIASDGRVLTHTSIRVGRSTTLVCAARALEQLKVPAAARRKGDRDRETHFNPRQGSR